MTMQRWDPWANMRSLRSAMDDLLERSFITSRWGDEETGMSFPVDVSESENEVRVRAALPGIKPEDLDISVQENLLTIRGESREETTRGDENWQRREIRTGSFVRSFTLPTTVDSDAAEASFDNGILELRLPKREEARPRRIQVGGTREAIPTSMRGGTTEQGGQSVAPPTSAAETGSTTADQGMASRSMGGSTIGSGSPTAVQSESYDRPQGVDEAPTEDPFGLREEERRGDVT